MIDAIPSEVLTLGGSTMLGGGLKLAAKWLAYRSQKAEADREHQLVLAGKQAEVRETARDYQGPEVSTGFHWTRRLIALVFVLMYVAVKLLPAFSPIVTIYLHPLVDPGVPLVGQSSEVIHAFIGEGAIVMTPIDTHLMASVFGFFFGDQITRKAFA